jgi:hypothetical protein
LFVKKARLVGETNEKIMKTRKLKFYYTSKMNKRRTCRIPQHPRCKFHQENSALFGSQLRIPERWILFRVFGAWSHAGTRERNHAAKRERVRRGTRERKRGEIREKKGQGNREGRSRERIRARKLALGMMVMGERRIWGSRKRFARRGQRSAGSSWERWCVAKLRGTKCGTSFLWKYEGRLVVRREDQRGLGRTQRKGEALRFQKEVGRVG